MISVLLLAVLAGAAALYAFYRGGAWRRQAKENEAINHASRKAHEIQNRVTFDPAYRDRVRRDFEQP